MLVNVAVYKNIDEKIIEIRQQHVIIDADVADLYGVDTKQINQAVSRNTEKFPNGYILELTKEEKIEVVTNCDHLNHLKYSPNLPKAFTEKGLYMLATILKSTQATETTISIIGTFAKVREISKTIKAIPSTPQDSPKYQQLMLNSPPFIQTLS